MNFSETNWGAIIADDFKIGEGQKLVEEKTNFCVGPIWGNYEAAEKANRWIEENKQGEGWHFTGHWNSEGGTSYC